MFSTSREERSSCSTVIDKTGQFCFDFLPPLLDDLIRPFLFFEKDGHRQKKDHRRQDRKDQQGRYYQQPDQPPLTQAAAT